MASLRELLAAHQSLLLIDAASTLVQVGRLEAQPGATPPFRSRWHASSEEAGVAIFRGLEALAVKPTDAAALVFCDGPGSVLGIRTSAMAMRTWRVLRPIPVFAYHSLALVAATLATSGLTVIADARRESWHTLSLGTQLSRIPTAELSGELVMPENFRHWSKLPPGVRLTPYRVEELLSRAIDSDLFRASDAPDAFLHEEPSYATWTPQVHRAP
jgi:Inactive homolog of metal-dependent proteases, putative molecular chaperone